MAKQDYPYREKGPRPRPDAADVRAFARGGNFDAGRKTTPAAARLFQQRAARQVSSPPSEVPLPRWVLALRQREVSLAEFAETVYKRTLRAPTKENLTLALMLANEIARAEGGGELVAEYVTPELLAHLGAERKGGSR